MLMPCYDPPCIHERCYETVGEHRDSIFKNRKIFLKIDWSLNIKNIIICKHEQNRKDFLCLSISALVSGVFTIKQWQRILSVLHLLPLWSRILLEELIGFQIDKKFPSFHVTRKFITIFTSARHVSLSQAISIQSILPKSHFLKVHLSKPLVPFPFLRSYKSINPTPKQEFMFRNKDGF